MENLEIKTTVPLEPCLFRSESELQEEEKGGYLTGDAQLVGLDLSTEEVTKIEIYLESNHPSKMHCNSFRISKKHSQMKTNGFKNKKEKQNMSAETQYIKIVRDKNNKMVLDPTNHKSYFPTDVKDIDIYNENTQTLKFGGPNALNILIWKPLSKQENGKDTGNRRITIKDVLMYKKQLELQQQFESPEKVSEELDKFKRDQLGPQSKKEKEKSTNLLNFLSESQNIHKAKLKLVYTIRQKNLEINHNGSESYKKVEAVTEWILASNLYTMAIDKERTDIQLLDNASIRLLNVMLSDCQATLALRFEAEFYYQQIIDELIIEEPIAEEEIEIIQMKTPDNFQPSQSVLRIGGSKTHTLQFYYKSKCGSILKKVKDGLGTIVLKIKMLDDSGIGMWDAVKAGIIEHDCQYDKTIQYYDDLNNEISNEEKIKHWIASNRLSTPPCILCKYDGCHARKQFHVETQKTLTGKGKRRHSQNSDPVGTESKRNRCIYLKQ